MILIGLTLSACSNDPIVLTIEFDSRGGQPVSPIQITEDEPFILPTPIREGYDFVGWQYRNQILDEPDLKFFIESNTLNIYLAAQWTVMKADAFTVHFVNPFGLNPDSVSFAEGESIELPILRDEENLIFKGWFLDSALSIPFMETTLTEDLTLYAGYDRIISKAVTQIAISFDSPIRVNQNVGLRVLIEPADATFKDYYLESSDSDIVEIIDLNTIFIHDLGTVTLAAIALDQNTRFETTLEITRYGVSNQQDLDRFIERGLNGTVELVQGLTQLVIRSPLSLNFNGYQVATLNIETQSSGQITLENGSIQTALNINAPNLRIVNSLNVLGLTTIQQIGKTSFITEGRHSQSIVMEGPGRIELKGAGSNTPLQINTSEEVILSGELKALVRVIASDANVKISGSVERLIIENTANISVIKGASINELQAGDNQVNLQLESDATVNLTSSQNVTIERIQRVYINGISAPSGGFYTITQGQRINFIDRTPTRTGHQFLGWYTDANYQTPFNFSQPIDQDITLYARWQINTYQVNYGGVNPSIPPATVNFGSNIPSPQVPPKEGHRFVGWFLDASFNQPVNFSQSVEQNLTIYAKYEPNLFTVSFSHGSVENQAITFNQRAIRPSEPVREGHRFIGWFIDPGFERSFDFNSLITEDLTLFPRFEINQYNVLFSGTNLPSVQVNYNQTISRPSNPTKTGHTFRGWYEDPNFEKSFNFSTRIVENITLYPKFEAITYDVRFNLHAQGLSLSSQRVEYSKRPQLEYALERDRYLFAGWYFDEAYQDRFTLSSVITNTTTLHARWIENEDNQKGIIHFMNENRDPIIIDLDTKINLPTLTREGHRFQGWFEDSARTIPIREQLDESVLTIYAGWQINRYQVTFTGVDSSIPSQTVNFGSRVPQPSAPEKEGYRFVGWYFDANFNQPVDASSRVERNVTLYAKYELNTYTVFFNNSSIENITVQYNERVRLPSPPTRTGHRFVGWFTDSQFENSFSFSRPIRENTQLYAKFEINRYNVFFPGLSIPTITVAYGSSIERPANPIREGYTFRGWYADSSFQEPFNFSQPITVNTTIYPRFEINVYSVNFNLHSADLNMPSQTVIFNNQPLLSYDLTRSGYLFAGWYLDATYEERFTITHTITDTTTLHAKWIQNEDNIDGIIHFINMNQDPIIMNQNAQINLSSPSRLGHRFVGWFEDPSFTIPLRNQLTQENLEVYAKFEIITYEVRFIANNTTYQTQAVDFGRRATLPVPAPERPNFQFVGWYLDANFETPFNVRNAITENTDLYAKFEIIKYRVSFQGANIEDQIIDAQQRATRPTNPTREGFIFEGWFTDKDYTQPFNFNQLIDTNLTLYAQWQIRRFNVSFVTNDSGLSFPTQIVNIGESPSLPSTPVSDGRTFLGWYTNSDFTERFSFGDGIQNNTTLYANWLDEIKLYIYFKNIDRDYIEVMSGNIIQLEDPIRQGHDFLGWFEDENYQIPLREEVTDESIDVYALFIPREYRIDYDTGPTQLNLEHSMVSYNQTINSPDFVVTGYTFEDWYVDPDFNTLFDFGTRITEPMTLYGRFTINTFDILFNPNIENLENIKDVVEFNQIVTDPLALFGNELNREGYKLVGWYLDSEFTEKFDFDSPIKEDLNLYAKWEVRYVTVTFFNGGLRQDVSVTYGSILSSLSEPQRLGHTFANWYLSSEFNGGAYGFNSPITNPLTLYAKWQANTYKVRYLESDGVTLIEERLVTYGATLIPPSVQLNLGEQLSGWSLNDNLISLSTYKMPAQDISLNAVIANTNSLLVTVELYAKTSNILQVEVWLRGNVEINAYDLIIEFNQEHLSYSNHLQPGLFQAINTSQPNQIRLNYSNVNQSINSPSMVIRIEFNRLSSASTLIDVKMVEGYLINNLNQIIPVLGEPIPLTINE